MARIIDFESAESIIYDWTFLNGDADSVLSVFTDPKSTDEDMKDEIHTLASAIEYIGNSFPNDKGAQAALIKLDDARLDLSVTLEDYGNDDTDQDSLIADAKKISPLANDVYDIIQSYSDDEDDEDY